jgi:hypothetical protein
MAMYGEHPPLKLAKDPSDPVWHWFICNGPHGERFSWAREIAVAPDDLLLLKEFIDEKISFDPEFEAKARTVALQSLDISNVAMVRKAIQVLCIIGTDKDMELIKELVLADDEEIVKDAKCCLFERRIKIKT